MAKFLVKIDGYIEVDAFDAEEAISEAQNHICSIEDYAIFAYLTNDIPERHGVVNNNKDSS